MQYSTHLYRHLKCHIGENIHTLRKQQKMTMEKLSKLSGVPLCRLDHYELGKNNPHFHELFKITCALNVKMRDVL